MPDGQYDLDFHVTCTADSKWVYSHSITADVDGLEFVPDSMPVCVCEYQKKKEKKIFL